MENQSAAGIDFTFSEDHNMRATDALNAVARNAGVTLLGSTEGKTGSLPVLLAAAASKKQFDEAAEGITQEELAPLADDLRSDSSEFVALMERTLEQLKQRNSEIFTSEHSTPEQKGNSFAVLDSLSMVENPEKLLDSVGIYENSHSIAFTDTLVKRFRSLCRVARISNLDVRETVSKIKAIEDKQFRHKMTLMINIIMLHVNAEPKRMAGREAFVRFQFSVIKYAIAMRITPVLASVAYERYNELFLTRK